KIDEYKQKFANPFVAASQGYIDEIIEPKHTRSMILHALKVSENKDIAGPKKKHGIPPF
ncbi:MAG: methylmalonyl-CoA carboxyltransferase, partial [Mariniphaga sp.]|nr:methylmalonyl-CoA carboxyltransferase [Mariniphaga sp.]